MTLEKLAGMVNKGFSDIEAEMNRRFDAVDGRFEGIDQRIDKLEEKEEERFHFIMDALAGFLKRMTTQEDEFVLLKNDTNVIRKALKQKLGLDVESPECR